MEILGVFFFKKNNNVLSFFKYYDQFALYSCTSFVCMHAPAPVCVQGEDIPMFVCTCVCRRKIMCAHMDTQA